MYSVPGFEAAWSCQLEKTNPLQRRTLAKSSEYIQTLGNNEFIIVKQY